ncbi:unnamed protein product, partial [Sphacelaria rigidula]
MACLSARHGMYCSCVGRPGSSVGNLETDGWDVDWNLSEVTRSGVYSNMVTNSGERLWRECTNFDFTVDEGKVPSNPFGDQEKVNHRRGKIEYYKQNKEHELLYRPFSFLTPADMPAYIEMCRM